LTEQVMTMEPDPAAIMPGSAARVTRTAASRFKARLVAQSSSLMLRKPPGRARALPTLLTRMSTLSPASSISLAGAAGSARSTAAKVT